MPDVALERIDPDRNCFRFYDMGIELDLFGTHCLVIHWGRLGRPGRLRIAASGTEPEIAGLVERLSARKRARGYCRVARPG